MDAREANLAEKTPDPFVAQVLRLNSVTRKQDLLAEIRSAFSGYARVGTQQIARGDSIEAQMVKHFLSPRSWLDLDADALHAYDSRADLSALIAFLTPEGFRYYLPSLLSFVVDGYAKAGLLIDALIFKLASGSEEYGPNTFPEAQRLAVSRFLSYLKETHPDDKSMGDEIDRALSRWKSSDPEERR